MVATGKAVLAGLGFLSTTQAFYIPGWSIRSYKDGEQIPLLVNKAYSDNTEIQYAYYDLPFVAHPQRHHHAAGGGLLSGQSIPLNLGEVLRGDRIIASDVELNMGQDKVCSWLGKGELSESSVSWAQQMIEQGYVVEWIVDNLPGATTFVTVDKTKKYYAAGFKLGYMELDLHTDHPRYYLYNHYTIVVRYRRAPGKKGDEGEKVVVGFEVYPKSIGPQHKRDKDGCPIDLSERKGALDITDPGNRTEAHGDKPLDSDAPPEVQYTYSVYFREENNIEWSHRWDLYFVNQDEGSRIHWLAIVNSLFICGLLTGVVMVILTRTIRTDIKGYKDGMDDGGRFLHKRKTSSKSGSRTPTEKKTGGGGWLDQAADGDSAAVADQSEHDDGNEALEDVSGWKLLHADVFRTPSYGYLLAPLVGSGMQLLFMAVSLVLLSAFGILNPSFRGGFLSVGIGLFVFAGLFSGYCSARVFKSFDGKNYRRNALVTALLFPGMVFAAIFVLNLFVWAQASSTAIPFTTLLAILVLWLCVQVPLVYAGSYYGYWRSSVWEHPTKTAAIPRQLPRQPWYLRTLHCVLLAGLVPFAVIFIELLFVFQSLWQDKSGYYYVFGFLSVVFLILVATIAEVTIVSVYIQLCSENYHWWWQSFFVGGGSALWVFAYSAWYYLFKLHIEGFVSSMLFFAYSFMACCVYGLLTGTVGFLSAYAFVRRIYGAIKVD